MCSRRGTPIIFCRICLLHFSLNPSSVPAHNGGLHLYCFPRMRLSLPVLCLIQIFMDALVVAAQGSTVCRGDQRYPRSPASYPEPEPPTPAHVLLPRHEHKKPGPFPGPPPPAARKVSRDVNRYRSLAARIGTHIAIAEGHLLQLDPSNTEAIQSRLGHWQATVEVLGGPSAQIRRTQLEVDEDVTALRTAGRAEESRRLHEAFSSYYDARQRIVTLNARFTRLEEKSRRTGSPTGEGKGGKGSPKSTGRGGQAKSPSPRSRGSSPRKGR